MKLEHSFTVAAGIDTVWEALTNVERVAPCLPGATLGASDEEGTYEGTFSVKLGPATAAYEGSLEMAETDATSHTTTMRASGRDRRGQGSASATIVSSMKAEGEGTRVDVVTDFTITGRLARFGRGGMIQDVSNRLLGDFASCLQERLAPASAPPEPGADAGGGPASDAAGIPPADAPPMASRTPAPAKSRPLSAFSVLMSVLRARLRRLLRRRS